MRCIVILGASLSLLLGAIVGHAGQADVLKVDVRALGGGRYQINTTVKHADRGWDHYANAWQVLDHKGQVLGERVLHHPHDNEQPFTRSLTINIPAAVKRITVQAKDSVHGYGGKAVTVTLPSPK